jgi:hypothetical protein
MRRCNDEKRLRWEDATMWRWQEKIRRRCEDAKMWRWEALKTKPCRREDMNMKTGENVSQTPTIGRTLRSDALGQQDSLHLATLIKDQSPKLSQCTIATLVQAKETRLRHSGTLRIMDDKNVCNNTSLMTSNVFAMFVLTCHQWSNSICIIEQWLNWRYLRPSQIWWHERSRGCKRRCKHPSPAKLDGAATQKVNSRPIGSSYAGTLRLPIFICVLYNYIYISLIYFLCTMRLDMSYEPVSNHGALMPYPLVN